MRSINSQSILDRKDMNILIIPHTEMFLISIQNLYNHLMDDVPHLKIIEDCEKEFIVYSGQLKMRLEALANNS